MEFMMKVSRYVTLHLFYVVDMPAPFCTSVNSTFCHKVARNGGNGREKSISSAQRYAGLCGAVAHLD